MHIVVRRRTSPVVGIGREVARRVARIRSSRGTVATACAVVPAPHLHRNARPVAREGLQKMKVCECIIIKLMLNNAEDFKLDLAAKDKWGRTGLELAQDSMNMNVVKLITKKLQLC